MASLYLPYVYSYLPTGYSYQLGMPCVSTADCILTTVFFHPRQKV